MAAGQSARVSSQGEPMKRICVDLDGICADFLGGVWPEYYAQGGDTNISTKDVTDFYELDKLPYGDRILPIFHTPGFLRNLKIIPGARAPLQLLADCGFEIVIV